MKAIKQLKCHMNDDELLNLLILFETRKLEAARKLRAIYAQCFFDISALDALKLLSEAQIEMLTPSK